MFSSYIAHTKNISRLQLLAWLTVPLVLWNTLLLLWYFSSTMDVLHSSTISASLYGDQEVSGKSSGVLNAEMGTYEFSYQLNEGFQYPYMGLHFAIPPYTFNSLNATYSIKIVLSTTRGKEIPLILNERVVLGKDTIYRIWQQNIKINKGLQTYILKISDFAVPAWWYKSNQCQESDFKPLDISKVAGVCIQNCIFTQVGQKDSIRVEKFIFLKDYTRGGYVLGSFTLLWLLAGFGYVLWKSQKVQSVFIPYVVTEVQNMPEDDWVKIQIYFSQNYMKDLSMEIVQKDLGIAKHKIATLVKKHTTLIIKQYLNQIRIAEAKRLLVETDLPIGEISDLVGYGHISNFNRVFKEHTSQAPTDLRKGIVIN